MILWSKHKGYNLSKIPSADVIKTLQGLRQMVVLGQMQTCGLMRKGTDKHLCWVCSMPKHIGLWPETWAAAEDCLVCVVGAEDPYKFELWPSRNGKAAVLKAIDAAIVLAGMSP